MGATQIGADAMVEFYIDSRTGAITSANPIAESDDENRQIVELLIYEGMSAFEAKGVLDGWLASFRGTQPEQRRTVARVRIG